MKIYEVRPVENVWEEGDEYFATKAEALAFAKEASREDGEFGDAEDIKVELIRFNPSKTKVIALMNGIGWRPDGELIARFKDGKRVQ